MKKTTRIIIAVSIALIVVVSVNAVYKSFVKSQEKQVLMVTTAMNKGDIISKNNVEKVTLSYTNNLDNYLAPNLDAIYSEVLAQDVFEGQILLENMISNQENVYLPQEEYEYISLPVSNASDAMSYQLKKGNMVNVYYTAKYKLVDNIFKQIGSLVTYSTLSGESLMTCRLFENIQVMDVFNEVGTTATKSDVKYSQIVLKVSKAMALYIANLKEQGNFTVTMIK